jgi:hypothetical protein
MELKCKNVYEKLFENIVPVLKPLSCDSNRHFWSSVETFSLMIQIDIFGLVWKPPLSRF